MDPHKDSPRPSRPGARYAPAPLTGVSVEPSNGGSYSDDNDKNEDSKIEVGGMYPDGRSRAYVTVDLEPILSQASPPSEKPSNKQPPPSHSNSQPNQDRGTDLGGRGESQHSSDERGSHMPRHYEHNMKHQGDSGSTARRSTWVNTIDNDYFMQQIRQQGPSVGRQNGCPSGAHRKPSGGRALPPIPTQSTPTQQSRPLNIIRQKAAPTPYRQEVDDTREGRSHDDNSSPDDKPQIPAWNLTPAPIGTTINREDANLPLHAPKPRRPFKRSAVLRRDFIPTYVPTAEVVADQLDSTRLAPQPPMTIPYRSPLMLRRDTPASWSPSDETRMARSTNNLLNAQTYREYLQQQRRLRHGNGDTTRGVPTTNAQQVTRRWADRRQAPASTAHMRAYTPAHIQPRPQQEQGTNLNHRNRNGNNQPTTNNSVPRLRITRHN
ncbi:hypothetical protein V8F20_003980 [Naviculisporaceae sp. PSN 640]